jgi:hypothetical protein
MLLSKSFASTILLMEPQKVEIGIFLTSLYDVNSTDGSFSADLWFWSKSQSHAKFNLQNVEVNYLSSKFPQTYTSIATYPLDNEIVYQSRKLHGTFLHDYDIKNFPFDRQILEVHHENIEANTKDILFTADTQSGFDKKISIDGWKIISVTTKVSEKVYGSNFGYTIDDVSVGYSRITTIIDLKRDAPLVFLKVTLGLFASVILALLSCFLRSDNDDLFSARIGLLGGALLAVVFNQQFADTKSGQTTAVTLIDSLHMLGIFTILVLFVGSVASRFIIPNNTTRMIFKLFDRILIVAMFFVFTSLSLIWTLNSIYS